MPETTRFDLDINTQLAEQRRIEKFGIYALGASLRKVQRLRVCVTVVREPSIEYLNNKYKPEKGFYGHYVVFRGGFAVASGSIDFIDTIVLDWASDANAATQQAYCTAVSVANNFVQAGLADSAAEITKPKLAPCPYTSISFWCYAETQLLVQADPLAVFSTCGEAEFDNDDPPDLPSQNPTPGNPSDDPPPSPPYNPYSPGGDDGTGDSGYTYVPPSRQGGCLLVTVGGNYVTRISGCNDYSTGSHTWVYPPGTSKNYTVESHPCSFMTIAKLGGDVFVFVGQPVFAFKENVVCPTTGPIPRRLS